MEEYLKALADETRLRIINLLLDNDGLSVTDIMNILEITQAKTSRHLIYMKHAGVLQVKKDAQKAIYSVVKDTRCRFLKPLVYECLRKDQAYTDDLNRLFQYTHTEETAK